MVFVSENVPNALREVLESRGWRISDVRLLSGREAALGKLEGISVGSIRAPHNQSELRALELELKVHKLLSDRTEAPKEKGKLLEDEESLDALLSFGRPKSSSAPALLESPVPLAVLPERKLGRRKGSKDSKPRKTDGYQELRGIALEKRMQKKEKTLVEAVPEKIEMAGNS